MDALQNMTLEQLEKLRERLRRSYDFYEEIFRSGIDSCSNEAEILYREFNKRISEVEAEINARKSSKSAFYRHTLQGAIDTLIEFKTSEIQEKISEEEMKKRLLSLNKLIQDLLSMKEDFDEQK